MNRSIATLAFVLTLGGAAAGAADEGTRHIVGEGVDMYFMNDKVFGTVGGSPLWAVYNCGSDINGEMDLQGTYRSFAFKYQEGDRRVVGEFDGREMSLGAIDKTDDGFVYHVFVGPKEYTFSIRYERVDDGHMLNSIIQGSLDDGRTLELTVDGRLCPFATTGIILIAAGSSLAG